MLANRSLVSTARAFFIVGIVSFACRVPAAAQDDGVRHGWWWGGGAGYGLATFSCDSCTRGPLSGWALFINGGVTPYRHLRLGVEGEVWLNGVPKGPLPTIDNWRVLLSYYPRLRGGPYLEAGIGLSHYGLEHGTGDFIDPTSKTEAAFAAAMGWGYTLGVGWQIPRGGGFLRAAYANGSIGTLHGGGAGSARWTQHLFLLEFGGVGP